MISALFGLASALGLGIADFMARFSARAFGAAPIYGAVLLIGSIGSTIWLIASRTALVWSPYGVGFAIAHGISVALMCILLYLALARGPVSVVAPIVAAHPALVLAANVLMGIRPSVVQWAAMLTILAAGILIARSATSHLEGENGGKHRRSATMLIALGACVAYAVLVITGQIASPLLGELETMWIGRCSGLLFVAVILLLQRASFRLPREWLPFVGLQGALDTLGYFAFLAGANTASPHVTMIVASGFSVVTVLLARIVLREAVTKIQWSAIALIALGTAVLSISS